MRFFGEHNPDIPERLHVYILSFLDPASLKTARQVSREWKRVVDKTKDRVALLPTIHRIPLLTNYSLAQIDIHQFSGGMTNRTYKLEVDQNKLIFRDHTYRLEITQNKWVIRVPGKGSSIFMNRKDEAFNAQRASDLQLNAIIDFFDDRDGLQLTRYLEDNRVLTKETLRSDPSLIPAIAQLFKCLHTSTEPFRNTINVFTRNTDLLKNLVKLNYHFPEDVTLITSALTRADYLFQQYRIAMTPCHNDATPTNFLLVGDRVKLLDWEYSGNNDLLWDLAYFSLYSELPRKQEEELLTSYFGQCNESILAWFDLYKPVIAWWVLLWSWTQLVNHADACPVESYQALADEYYEMTKKLVGKQFERSLDIIEDYTHTALFAATHMRAF